ncbi:hypothetical protein [Leifsonia sp. NPDC080035]|uniref:Uncharacterized protein n=1 Tax=Leifsonia sp. NPDC080035 TaxID=3143936 RepID=A0AAU7GCI2_9MICO
MSLWPEQPSNASQPPQTRRQARESERQAARRAGTAEPTPAGEIPDVTTSFRAGEPERPAPTDEAPAIPATAFADPGVHSPSRPTSSSGGFDDLVFDSGSGAGPAKRDDAAPAPDLFRQVSDPSTPEPVTQPVGVVPATPSTAGERTLTRRELRAMLQAQEANQQVNNAAPVTDAVFPVTFTPDDDAPAAAPATPAPAPTPAAPSGDTSVKTAWPFSAGGADAPAGAAPAGAAPARPSNGPDTAVTQSATSAFTALGIPTPWKDEEKPAAGVEAPDAPDAPAASPEERRPFTPPTGHWSTAAELDDKNAPVTSRNVAHSTAATTTNALILPSLPQADATGPLTSTGEILVTGSIDLPRGLGATGAHPDRIDSSDIDRLLDGEENEFNTSEVAPVRASRAISSHTSTRGVITPPKKRGNTLPVVLMVVAGVLAVGVIGLLVAAYALHLF